MHADPTEIELVALLDEPVRRALYEWVLHAARPVSREEAATAVGVSRALAAFHLDRLAAGGLLATEFRRLSGRTGPGAGRPSKLYRRGPRELSISVPARRYDVPADLLATTIERLAGPTPPEPLREAAHGLGKAAGAAARKRAGARPTRSRLRGALLEALEERGYEPFETVGNDVRLANCPFHALVDDHRELVCGMNLALAEGLLDGLGDRRTCARLDPQPGTCCVALGEAEPARPDA
jgi:predicted ArsR family transcriptional regulator